MIWQRDRGRGRQGQRDPQQDIIKQRNVMFRIIQEELRNKSSGELNHFSRITVIVNCIIFYLAIKEIFCRIFKL